jgi:hypothetical protein
MKLDECMPEDWSHTQCQCGRRCRPRRNIQQETERIPEWNCIQSRLTAMVAAPVDMVGVCLQASVEPQGCHLGRSKEWAQGPGAHCHAHEGCESVTGWIPWQAEGRAFHKQCEIGHRCVDGAPPIRLTVCDSAGLVRQDGGCTEEACERHVAGVKNGRARGHLECSDS